MIRPPSQQLKQLSESLSHLKVTTFTHFKIVFVKNVYNTVKSYHLRFFGSKNPFKAASFSKNGHHVSHL